MYGKTEEDLNSSLNQWFKTHNQIYLLTYLLKGQLRLAWQNWETWAQFPEPGYFEVWARAMDVQGRSQPMVVPGWNPRGYLNNACHRVAVQVV